MNENILRLLKYPPEKVILNYVTEGNEI